MGSKKGFVEPENYLTEVLPDGTLSIVRYRGSKANINVPSEIDGKRVTKIGDSSFCDCKSLISIELPDSIISIGEFAFYNCTRLTSIDLPDSITSIGGYTFAGCKSLTSINFPNSITSICDYTFSNCERLTDVDLPDSLTRIGDNAFAGCLFRRDSHKICVNYQNSENIEALKWRFIQLEA